VAPVVWMAAAYTLDRTFYQPGAVARLVGFAGFRYSKLPTGIFSAAFPAAGQLTTAPGT